MISLLSSPCSRSGSASWAQSNKAVRLVAMIRSQASRLVRQKRRAVADAGVQDDKVERAVGGASILECSFHRLAVGDVAGDDQAAERGCNRFQRLPPTAKQRDLCALRRQHSRRRRADAGASTGDQRMPSICPAHGVPSFGSMIGPWHLKWQASAVLAVTAKVEFKQRFN